MKKILSAVLVLLLSAGALCAQTQVNLATQVKGNLAVSHLDSGTNATASTFWRGDGTWAPTSGGSGTAACNNAWVNGGNTFTTTSVVIGVGNDSDTNFTFTLPDEPITTSSVVVWVNCEEQGTDDGAGAITGAGIDTGTIVYATGAIDVTFNFTPTAGHLIVVEYVGATAPVPTFGNQNAEDIKVITDFTERFRFLAAGGFSIFATGDAGKFQWPTVSITEDTNDHGQLIGLGDGVETNFVITLDQFPIEPSSMVVLVNEVPVGTDDGAGNLTGAGITSGTINYATGALDVTFSSAVPDGQYASVTDTITGNLVLTTDNPNTFTVVPNSIKAAAIGVEFAAINYLQLSTLVSGGPPAISPLGSVSLYAKSDGVDAIGSKKLYYVDQNSNEKEICTVGGTCGSGASLGPNPFIDTPGGLVGGYVNSAADATPGMFGSPSSIQFRFPDNAWLGGVAACIASAEGSSATASLTWVKQHFTSTTSQAIEDSGHTNIDPGVAAGCYKQTLTNFPAGKGDYIYVDATVIGTGAVQIKGWSAEVLGAVFQPVGALYESTVPLSTTVYSSAGQGESLSPPLTETTEANMGVVIPFAGTFSDLCIRTTTAQSGTGDLVVTLRKNGTTDTALTRTISASDAAGLYCDLSNSVAYSAGDWFTWSLANAATATSATISSISMKLVPTDTSTNKGMVVFPYSGRTLFTTPIYLNAFANVAGSATEADHWSPAPRALTLGSLYCYGATAPTNPATATVYRNGGSTSVTATITGTGVMTGTGTQAYDALDSFSLEIALGAGGAPTVASCSVAVQ